MLMKLVSRHAGIAQVSYGVTLDMLTPSPYVWLERNYTLVTQPLVRSSHTDEQISAALVGALERYFSIANVLHMKSAAGNGAAAALQDAASRTASFRVKEALSFLSGDEESIHAALHALHKEEARVIILVSGPGDAARVMSAAASLGMTGKGYVWVDGHGRWARELTWAAAPAWLVPDTNAQHAAESDSDGLEVDGEATRGLRQRRLGDHQLASGDGAAASAAVLRAMGGAIGIAPLLPDDGDEAGLPPSLASFLEPSGRLRVGAMTDFSRVLVSPPLVPSPEFPVPSPPTAASCPALFSPDVVSKGLPFDGRTGYVFDAVWALASAIADAATEVRSAPGNASALPSRRDVLRSLASGVTRVSPVSNGRTRFFTNGDREGVGFRLLNVLPHGSNDGVPVEIARWTPSAQRGDGAPHMVAGGGFIGAGAWGPASRDIVWASGTTSVPSDRASESSNSAAIAGLVAMVGVGLSLLIGAVLHHNDVHILPESGATVLVGCLFGLIIRQALGHEVAASAAFSEHVFFLVLLPVIIFFSGWDTPVAPFFRNLGSISAFAIAGTLASTAIIGLLVFGAGQRGIILSLTFEEAMAFASLLSATDPVATLAVFGALKVHPTVNALVAGEAVMNDAVAIVLYRTFTNFLVNDVTSVASAAALGSFVAAFVLSTLLGVLCGLLCALAFRFVNVSGQSREVRWQRLLRSRLAAVKERTGRLLLLSGRPASRAVARTGAEAAADPERPVGGAAAVAPPPGPSPAASPSDAPAAATGTAGAHTGGGGSSDELVDLASGASETAIILVFSYAAFLLAESVGMSGIVSSLAAGITMALYVKPILTRDGRLTSSAVLKMLASVADCAVFFSIGLNVILTIGSGSYDIAFIAVTLFGCLLGRALNVFPIAAALNLGRSEKISGAWQVQMWHAGLRGAIAYASALSFPSQHRETIINCTSGVVLITLFAMGGSTVPMLQHLRIPYGIEPPSEELDALLGRDAAPSGGDGGAIKTQPSLVKRVLISVDGAIRHVVYGGTFLREMREINERAATTARERAIRTGGFGLASPVRASGSTIELPAFAPTGHGGPDAESGDAPLGALARNMDAEGWSMEIAAPTEPSSLVPPLPAAEHFVIDEQDLEATPGTIASTAPGGAS